jgi:hypothetical protein
MNLPASRWLRPLAAAAAVGGCLLLAGPATAAPDAQLGTWSGTDREGTVTVVVKLVRTTTVTETDNGTTTATKRVVTESLQMADPKVHGADRPLCKPQFDLQHTFNVFFPLVEEKVPGHSVFFPVPRYVYVIGNVMSPTSILLVARGGRSTEVCDATIEMHPVPPSTRSVTVRGG